MVACLLVCVPVCANVCFATCSVVCLRIVRWLVVCACHCAVVRLRRVTIGCVVVSLVCLLRVVFACVRLHIRLHAFVRLHVFGCVFKFDWLFVVSAACFVCVVDYGCVWF